MVSVAHSRPDSLNNDIASDVAKAEAMTLTALLPIKIAPMSPSRSARKRSTSNARRLPLLANWRMRASEAAVSAVSALEKNAEAIINSNIVAAIHHKSALIIDWPQSHHGRPQSAHHR